MLKQLQAGTGVLFAVFLSAHLINTWLAAFGPGLYDAVQAALRVVYQFAPLEALLLAALATHLVVGVMRIVSEPKRQLTVRAKLHRYAGFFLMIVIVGHILAVRGSSWFYDVYPGFAGLAFSIEWVPAYFYPYYFLLGVAGFYHGLNGLSIALPRLGVPLTMRWPALRVSTAVASVAMVAALMGLGGFFFDVGDVSESAFAQLAFELVGESTP